jgi:NAD+ diphosphatase
MYPLRQRGASSSQIMPTRTPNVLAGPYIDRAAHRRKDLAWLEQAANDPRSLFIPVWQAKNLVSRTALDANTGLSAMLVEREQELFVSLQPHSTSQIFLGVFRDRACFALAIDEVQVPPALDTAEFLDIRTSISSLDRDEAGLLAYARALVTWRERHRFCGKCGAPTEARQAGHAVKCVNAECSVETFPRIDPAIIVLITDGERCLLGRQAAWRPGWYSTIAGFVEAGESLEDAVRREVLEETGVEVEQVEYHSSQPWPFPQSLMLGFVAHATTTAINRSDDELEDARWFTREQIASGFVMTPPPISISGCLLEDWYNRDAVRPLSEEPAARTWNSRTR